MEKRGKIIVLLLIALIIAFSLPVFAGDLLSLQGNVDLSGTPVSSGGVIVEIWDGPDVAGSNLIYNSTDNFTSSGNISSGKFDIVLGSVGDELNLEYGKVYYMDLYIAGNDMNFSSKERQEFMSSVGTINSSFLNTSNDYTFNSLLIENKTIAVDDAFLNISDGVTPKFIVSPDGKVGIGTTSLTHPLYVYGTAVNSAQLLISGGTGDAGIHLQRDGGGFDVKLYDQAGNFIISGGDDTATQTLFKIFSSGNTAVVNNLVVGDNVDGVSYGFEVRNDVNLNNTLYVIKSSGNVGIGTASPAALLHIENSSAVSDAYFNISDGETPKFLVTPDGKVGIGTGSPSYALQVGSYFYVDSGGTSYIGGRLDLASGGIALRIMSNGVITTSSNDLGIQSDTDYDIKVTPGGSGDFMVNDSDLFVDTSAGRVGIGTTSPAALLHIENSSGITVPYFNISDGVSDKFVIDEVGNITVGYSGGGTTDLLVYGSILGDGLVESFSPVVLASADGEPIPICMKNSKGKWVGCMPDENNKWKCAPNRECDKKILRVKTTHKLMGEGVSDAEIDEEVESLKKKFKQGKSLQTIKEEVREELGEMHVLDELDDTQPSDKSYGIQTQGVSSSNVDVEIDALKAENELLKQRLVAIEKQLNSQTTIEPETSTEPKPPTEQPSEPEQIPEEQPVEQQPIEEPAEEPLEEQGFSITGASVWNWFSSLIRAQ